MPGSVLGPGTPTVIQSDDNMCCDGACILVEGKTRQSSQAKHIDPLGSDPTVFPSSSSCLCFESFINDSQLGISWDSEAQESRD